MASSNMSKVIDVTKHLTVEEAARELDVEPAWVRGLVGEGKITGIKRGGIWFFDPTEIERYKSIRRKPGRQKGHRTKNT
jgi:hypothetical protein